MRKMIGACVWAALLASTLGVRAEDGSKPPGKRLRLQVKETRQRGDATATSRTSTLLLHADTEAFLFLGTQLAITQSERETSTTQFKNAGVTVKAKVAALPDGRYRLESEYENSQKRGLSVERAPGVVTAGNPVLQTVKARSLLTVRESESVPFANAVDPVTGEVVRVELSLVPAPTPRAAATPSVAATRLSAQLVLTRRQGQTTLARRPYAVLLQDGGDGQDRIEVFSGSQLPVQTRANNQVTVMLKDVGAGLKLEPQRLEDGSYKLSVRFGDGVLSPGEGAPELRVFQSESVLVVRAGETLTLASAVDPQSGEVVEAELTLEGVK
jgi:hypothetical protein